MKLKKTVDNFCLNLDEQRHRYRALDDWFKTPQGQHLGEAFSVQLARFEAYVRGDTVLQLGLCGDSPWIDALLFNQKFLVTPCLDAPNTTLVASPQTLPLERHSVDAIIAPMTCEIFGHDKRPLDEIDRVLKPMGHAIFLGFNPFSLWGMALRCQRLPCFGHASVTLTSSFVLKRALLARGYQQEAFEAFYYLPPFRKDRWIKRFLFLNEMGKLASLFPAGFYCLIMQKYEALSPSLRRAPQETILLPG